MDNNENVVQPEATPVQTEMQVQEPVPQNVEETPQVEEKVPSPEEAQQELKVIMQSFGFDRNQAESETTDKVI